MSRSPPTLATRIVTAFVLMTAGVAGVFSISVKMAVDYVEVQLVSDSLNRQLDFILSERVGALHEHIGPGLRLYVIQPEAREQTAPAFARGLEPGLHELENQDEAFHIMVRDVEGLRYVLVLNQDEFERRESQLQFIVAVGFLACILAAWILGKLLARRVIAPVVRLSEQVQHRDQLLPLAPPLASDYGHDEIGKLAAAFDSTLSQLKQALEREQLFTSDVSHELRTPLMVIASSCELLDERGLDPRQRAVVIRISRACAEMTELVDTFLQLARVRGSSDTELPLTTLAHSAREQHHRWQEEAGARGLALELTGEADDRLRYPAPLLRTVISNLVRNALHYTDHGYVRIELRSDGFSIVDSGAGIPEGERVRLFTPFTRGDPGRGDGVGIGLSLAQRICASQGWHIDVVDRQPGGCEFRVVLSPPSSTGTV